MPESEFEIPGRVARTRLRWLVIISALALAGAIYLYRQKTPGDSPMPQCMFYRGTGWYCPGCGSSRAVHALLHARLLAAWRSNPLLIIAMPLILWFGGRWTWDVLRRRPPRPAMTSWRRPIILGIAAVIALYWIGRNLPWWPFSLLAPR